MASTRLPRDSEHNKSWGSLPHPADAECRAMMENCAEPQWQQANTDTDTSLEALDALQTH